MASNCTMTYNDVDTSVSPYWFRVTSFDRPMRGASRVSYAARGLQHGVVATGGALDVLRFTLHGVFMPEDDESLTYCIDAMNALLDHWTPRALSISARPDRFAEVLAVDEAIFESDPELPDVGFVSIPFSVPAGCWLGTELHEVTGRLISAELIPDGSLPALPTYYLSGSAADGVGLSNMATGEGIYWGNELSGTLTIDCERQLCYEGGSINMENKFGSYPSLLPRQDNQLATSGFDGSVTAKWRDRFHFGGALT